MAGPTIAEAGHRIDRTMRQQLHPLLHQSAGGKHGDKNARDARITDQAASG
jgi:hypothetical protein